MTTPREQLAIYTTQSQMSNYFKTAGIYNLAYFGAKSSKDDNASAIADAINFFKERGGGTLLIPDERFFYSDIPDINFPITIIGTGKTSILEYTGNDYAIKVLKLLDGTDVIDSEGNLYGLVLNNFVLRGNNRQQSANGLLIQRSDWFTVSDLYVENFKGYGIHLNNSREGVLQNIHTRWNGIQAQKQDILMESSNKSVDRSNENRFVNVYSIFSMGSNMLCNNADRNHFIGCMFHGLIPPTHPGYAGWSQYITNTFGADQIPDYDIYKYSYLARCEDRSHNEFDACTFTSSGKNQVETDNSKVKINIGRSGGFYAWGLGETISTITNASYNAGTTTLTLTLSDASDIVKDQIIDVYDVSGTATIKYNLFVESVNTTTNVITCITDTDITGSIALTEDTVRTQSSNHIVCARNESFIYVNSITVEDCSELFARDHDSKVNFVTPKIDAVGRASENSNFDWELYNNVILKDGYFSAESIKNLLTCYSVYYRSRSTTEPIVQDASYASISEAWRIESKKLDGTKIYPLRLIGNGTDTQTMFLDNNVSLGLGGGSKLKTDNAAASTSVSGLSYTHPIYDSDGTLLGYIPIYSTKS